MQHTGNITVQAIVMMRLRTFSHKLKSFSITTITLSPHQQAQRPILAFFTKVKITKYKQQNGMSEVASFPGNHPAVQIWELNIALSPGTSENREAPGTHCLRMRLIAPRCGDSELFLDSPCHVTSEFGLDIVNLSG